MNISKELATQLLATYTSYQAMCQAMNIKPSRNSYAQLHARLVQLGLTK